MLFDCDQVSTAILDRLPAILQTLESINSVITDSDALLTVASAFKALMETRADKFQSQADIRSACSIMAKLIRLESNVQEHTDQYLRSALTGFSLISDTYNESTFAMLTAGNTIETLLKIA